MLSLFKKIVVAVLVLESRLVLKKYRPFIVAVTGSVGKTSAKDAIYSVLAADGQRVRKSEKSFNSEIGVPLTILGVKNAWKNPLGWLANAARGLELVLFKVEYPDILVLEVGADHPGDIESLAAWLRPDVAVITKVGDVPVHVEFFDSPKSVLREKLFLARGVKAGGTVVLYADDEKVLAAQSELATEGRTIMTYGMKAGSTVQGSFPLILYKESAESGEKPTGMTFKLDHAGASVPVALSGVLGTSHIYPVLAAAAVGLARGMPLSSMIEAVTKYEVPRGRMNILAGTNGSTLIDDTYNSSPAALAAALAALAEVEGAKRKVAVLGDMMELGRYSPDEHKKAGALAARSLDTARGDLLVTVGQRAKGLRDGALAAGMSPASILAFDASSEAAEKMRPMARAGDVILIKGSQSPRMERVTKALMADPSLAPELLVRQEPEWLEKK